MVARYHILCSADASTPYIGCQSEYVRSLRRIPSFWDDSSVRRERSRPERYNPSVDERVLIVEDDPSLREVIRLGLEGEDYRVATAEDGPSALIAFASNPPDLVLLDVMLPGLDGFAVCRELRKVSLVPIVMLTARTSTSDVVEGLEAGADDYVTKPFEFPELIARLRSVLRRASVRVPAAGSEVSAAGAVASGTTGAGADVEAGADRPAETIPRLLRL